MWRARLVNGGKHDNVNELETIAPSAYVSWLRTAC